MNTPQRPPLRMFERVVLLADREGMRKGDEGEISAVFANGDVMVMTKERLSGSKLAMEMAMGRLRSYPAVHHHEAHFKADEVRRRYERYA